MASLYRRTVLEASPSVDAPPGIPRASLAPPLKPWEAEPRRMAESKTAVIAALAGNAALAALKGVSAAATGSAAMLAETFHSIADTGNQLLLLLGMRLAQRPPDEARPFGHGRNVYFWAFVVSVMLFSLGGAFAIWEAIVKLRQGGEHATSAWTYGVLAGGFVFEAASLGVALHSFRKAKGVASLRKFWRDNRDPTLTTVILEDTAALFSLLVAATGIRLSEVTGDSVWDAAASGIIGVVLIAVALLLAAENYSLIIGESAAPEREARIRAAIESDAAVERLAGLYTTHLAPESVLVVAQVKFRPHVRLAELEAAVGRLEERVAPLAGSQTTRRMIVIEPAPAFRDRGMAA
jgi:cation diffusion facilitator family transporter